MYKVTQLLGLAVCLLAFGTASLSAQSTTYEVNFASIRFVNLNLGDDCSREVIYNNILSGEPDIDGDGMVPPESAFTITIDDDDPSNGNILDGCGSFNYQIVPAENSGIIGFTFGSGTINAFDVTPPAQFMDADAYGPFYTTELDELTINTLPANISRSFMVDGQTTMPIMGSLSSDLMLRLIAGGEIPRFSDGCSDVDVIVSDAINRNGDCEDIIITRTFTATDASADCVGDGRSSGETMVSYDILLERPSGEDVMGPASVATFECNDPTIIAGVFPKPAVEDYPFLNGPDGPVYLNETFGNLGSTYSDSEAIITCNSTYKFIRTFTIIDWCDTENVRTFTQVVKVGDTAPPTVMVPAQDLDFDGMADDGPLVFTTNAPNCGAFVPTNMGGLQITDGCSSISTVQAFVLVDRLEGNIIGPINVNAPNPVDRLTPFLPAGPHTLRYIAIDDCGNEGIQDVDILIEDRSGPVIIAEDALNISLSNSGFAEVTALDIDRGSYDDCSDLILEIAFANPNSLLAIGDFGPSLTLTCIDVGVVPVILRGTDANGNQNQRMSILNVVDNSAPLCIAPGSMNITCDQADDMLPEDLNAFFDADPVGTISMLDEMFGAPTSLDNCGNEVTTQTVNANINDCGTGIITRSFSVTDARGFVSAPGCQQIVSVGGMRDYTLEFPGDAETTCGNVPTFDDLMYTPFGCDNVVSNTRLDTFFASGEACYKLRRTIEVINWCEYDGIGAYYNVPRDADQDGNFEESTFLHVIPNGNTNPLDDSAILDRDGNRSNSNDIRNLDGDDNFSGSTPVDGDNDGDTGYANSRSRGAFRYIQFIKVYDETAPTITNVIADVTPGAGCEGGDFVMSYTLQDDCSPEDLTSIAELDFDYVSANGFTTSRMVTAAEINESSPGRFTINLSNVRPGEHAIRVRGMDGCGNTDGRIVPFTVTTGGDLSPICVGRLTFELFNDGDGGGIAIVEADDFVVDITGNCGSEDIRYSIYREEEEASLPGFVPQPGRLSFPVTCDDEGDLMVRVYIFDANGNAVPCNAVASIEAFGENICDDGGLGSLAGFITSPDNELLSGIEVHISDPNSMDDMMYTDNNGSFLFNGLDVGSQYMIRPNMPDEVDLSRVKTSDIFKITNHILGVQEITNPFRMVAADVNADGRVDIGDMVAIRRVILGMDDTFQNSPTWRFIRRNFSLDGLEEGWNPSIFPSTFTVSELGGHNRDADFVAIEIGDVFTELTPRSALALSTADQQLTAGESTELFFSAEELAGFQGTIEAALGLTIESWNSSVLGAGNINDAFIGQGLLALSYNGSEPLAGQEVLSLTVRATRDLTISDYLSITDRLSYPEAIQTDGSTAALSLQFSEIAGGGTLLHQNFPNPVAAQTTIVFDLPESGPVTLTVHDIQGRLLTERAVAGLAGRNTLMLSLSEDLKNTTGILTYTLAVGEERLSKRMTVVAR